MVSPVSKALSEIQDTSEVLSNQLDSAELLHCCSPCCPRKNNACVYMDLDGPRKLFPRPSQNKNMETFTTLSKWSVKCFLSFHSQLAGIDLPSTWGRAPISQYTFLDNHIHERPPPRTHPSTIFDQQKLQFSVRTMAPTNKKATPTPKKTKNVKKSSNDRIVKRPARGFHRFQNGMLNVKPKGAEKEL